MNVYWISFVLRVAFIIKSGPGRVAQSVTCLASGNRCESDSRGRSREFDPSPVPYFLGD